MNLKSHLFGCVALIILACLSITPINAQQDSALLDALVKKGVLTNKERQEIQTDEQTSSAQTAASKIQLSSSIKTITFYGDLRLRYELRNGTTPSGTYYPSSATSTTPNSRLTHDDSETMNRWRYRLRFGVKGDLYDNIFYGFRLATNPYYDRSGNVTFGSSDSAGPFGKGRSILAIDQAYLGWRPTNDITLTGGQMANPLYTTNLVWDDNLNPAGAAEQWDHNFDNGVEAFATAGQFVYQSASGNGITNTLNGTYNPSNVFMFAEQAGFKYKFNKDTYFKAAATFYSYSGTTASTAGGITSVQGLYSSSPINLSAPNNSPAYFNGPFVGAASAQTTNVSGVNNLAVLEVPMEFDFRIGSDGISTGATKDRVGPGASSGGWSVPVRIFSDFAYNLDANSRSASARDAINGAVASNFVGSKSTGNVGVTLNNSAPTGAGMSATDVANNKAMLGSSTFAGVQNSGQDLLDQVAYQVGVEVGQLKKKGDWDGKLYWQSTGYYAVDPNLIDADIFNAATNMQGVVVAGSYNWTDGLTSTVRYAWAEQVNDKLATPNVNQDLQLGTIQHYNLFQADLIWKF